MAYGVQAESLGDLIKNTLKELGRFKFTELMSDLQDFPAVTTLMKKNRVKLESGYSIQWNLLMNHSGSSRNQGLYAPDNVTVMDGMVTASVPWRHSTSNWAIDVREVDMNSGPAKIVDMIVERRTQAAASMVELLENNFWRAPSASDGDTPYGLPYWVTKNGTAGFTGGILTGYSDVAGLSPTTYPRWNNYAAPYTNVTESDFIRAARKAMTYIKFMPMTAGLGMTPPSYNTGDNWGHFTTYALIADLEEYLKTQNENLGNDIASKDGSVMFRRAPVTWVPRLDEDTGDPFYSINWGVFKTYILKSRWMKETEIPHDSQSHNVRVQHFDSSYQFVCKDRRRCSVLSTNTTYPNL
jgi:hypothetical protein